MANTLKTEDLRLNIIVNGDPARKELLSLEKSTRDLKQTNKDLRLEKSKLKKSDKDYLVNVGQLNDAIKENNATIKTNAARMSEIRQKMGITALSAVELKKQARELRWAIERMTPGDPGRKKLEQELAAINKQMGKVSVNTTKTHNSLSNMAKTVLPALGFAAVTAKIAQFGKELFNLSIQLEGDSRRASIVFGDSLAYVEDEAKKLSKAMGLTNKEFVAAAAATADLLIPLDFTREASAKMSTQLQSMAGALDEWTGGRLGAAEVSNILTKAMLGENEQLKQLGIAIRKDSEEYTSLVKLKMQDTTVTRAQAEAMATLELIQNKSADAQTAYTQSGNELLRMQKGVSRWWRQMKEDLVGYFDVSAADKLLKEQQSVNALAVEMSSANTTSERRNAIYEQLKSINPDIVKGFDAENVEVEKLKDNMKAYNEEMVTRIVMARLSAEEEEAISKAATKGADARMRELSISEKMATINKDIAFSGDDFNTKLEKTIAYLIEQGAQMDEVGRKSKIQVDRQGVINDSRSKEQKQLDDIMILTSSRNIMLEQQKELEGDVSGIQERLKVAKQLLGITKNEENGGNDPIEDQIKTIPILKKELESLKVARDKINITDEAALLQNQKEIEAKEALIKKYEDFGKTITKSLKDKKKAETVAFSSSLYFANEEARLRENMAADQQTVREEDLKAIEDKYKREKVLAETKYNEELLALGTDEEAKKALKAQFEADELQRNLAHLNALKTQMEQTLSGINMEDAMLTDDEKEALLLKIDELNLAISALKLTANADSENEDTSGLMTKMLFGINEGDELEDKIRKIGAFAVSVFNDINKIISNGEQRQLQEFEAANDKKKLALEERLNSGKLTQTQYSQAISALDEEAAKKRRKIAHDEAVRAKAIGIMQTLINTAASIVEASPVIPLMAMAAVIGAIQLGVIASTPVPALATGNRQKILADDGKTYNAKVVNKKHKSGLFNEPTYAPGFGLFGETQDPELVFNPQDTKTLLNSPALIDAINMTLGSTPQFAQGNATEIIRENNTVTTTSDPAQIEAMNRFSSVVERMMNEGIEANLMANEDYIRKHKKVINEYDTFKSKVSG